jgi:hypothetical protein
MMRAENGEAKWFNAAQSDRKRGTAPGAATAARDVSAHVLARRHREMAARMAAQESRGDIADEKHASSRTKSVARMGFELTPGWCLSCLVIESPRCPTRRSRLTASAHVGRLDQVLVEAGLFQPSGVILITSDGNQKKSSCSRAPRGAFVRPAALAYALGPELIYGGSYGLAQVRPCAPNEKCPPGTTPEEQERFLREQAARERGNRERQRAEDLIRGGTFAIFGGLFWGGAHCGMPGATAASWNASTSRSWAVGRLACPRRSCSGGAVGALS